MFNLYKSIPKLIEAVQFTDMNKDQVLNSLRGEVSHDFEDGMPILKVKDAHGDIAIVRVGDWIVKEAINGFYYSVKNDIFISTYQAEVKFRLEYTPSTIHTPC